MCGLAYDWTGMFLGQSGFCLRLWLHDDSLLREPNCRGR